MEKAEKERRLKSQLEALGIELVSENRVRMPVRVELRMVGKPQMVAASLQSPAPEISEKNSVAPKENDYVRATFRAISQTMFMANVNAGFGFAFLDFTRPGVLQAAVGMLAGATIYKDHQKSAGGWVGSVERDYWSESDPGLAAPGINVHLKLDAVADPLIARGVISDPPTVKAASVGMDFEFEPSHPSLDHYDFWDYQGQVLEEGGQTVRCIITRIVSIDELSMVWSGADPNAVKLEASPGGPRARSLKEGMEAGLIAPVKKGAKSGPQKKEAQKMEGTRLERVRAFLGAKAPAGIEDLSDGEALDLVMARGGDLMKRVKDAEAELAKIKPDAELGQAMMKDLRDEVFRVARIAELGTADGELPVVHKKAIEGMDRDELMEAKADYEKKGSEKFPMTCQACGSTNVARRSSLEEPEGSVEAGKAKKKSRVAALIFGNEA